MWHPEPGWQQLPGGSGPSTYGVWLAVEAGREVVVKRLGAPHARTTRPSCRDPRHFAYWRRAADVALSGVDAADAGAARPRPGAGRGGRRGHHPGAPARARRRQPRAVRRPRARPLRRGGPRRRGAGWRGASCAPGCAASSTGAAGRPWPGPPSPTSPTTCGSTASTYLARLDALPQVSQHGDPVPGQPARPRRRTRCWPSTGSALGHGPVGADLGYYALSAREDFEPLLDAYLAGLPAGLATRDGGPRSGRRSRRSTPCSAGPSGRWPGSPTVRARSPGSTATRASRRTCARCSGSSPRSRRCCGESSR